jgi:Icc-related predicted phosphoesterase
MIITLISDTHNKQRNITTQLPGGDLLLFAGDMTSMGSHYEVEEWMDWFYGMSSYGTKVCVAGNHDFFFEKHPDKVPELLEQYDEQINYLQDSSLWLSIDGVADNVHIYGTPWQPEFHNWAFNLPRLGDELDKVWQKIPTDVDILVTHSPACGYLDCVVGRYENLGCELLTERIREVKPKIHVCGHIHTGYGYIFNGDTHFFNASVLDESYHYTQKPMTIDWDPIENKVVFLD